MTRYREGFSWTGTVESFLLRVVVERPLLAVCSGRSDFGDVKCDRYELSDVRSDWRELPFKSDSFGAVFADPPWDAAYKRDVAAWMRESLRVAPVAYLMAPWLYGARWARLSAVWYRQFPGVTTPVLLSRYERACDSAARC